MFGWVIISRLATLPYLLLFRSYYFFVGLNALISGTTGPIRKILSVLDSLFIEEGYGRETL
jgi:hypothetical protein